MRYHYTIYLRKTKVKKAKISLKISWKNLVCYFVKAKIFLCWSPLLGECLFGKKDPSNGVDKNAVAVIHLNNCGKEEVVGHVPQNISKLVSLFLSLPHCYLLEVTRKHVKRGGGYGLEIRARFRFFGREKGMKRLETRLTKIADHLKESVNYWLKKI